MVILLQLVIVEPVECCNLFPYRGIYKIGSEVYSPLCQREELLLFC